MREDNPEVKVLFKEPTPRAEVQSGARVRHGYSDGFNTASCARSLHSE